MLAAIMERRFCMFTVSHSQTPVSMFYRTRAWQGRPLGFKELPGTGLHC
jgi:hypothetical protein